MLYLLVDVNTMTGPLAPVPLKFLYKGSRCNDGLHGSREKTIRTSAMHDLLMALAPLIFVLHLDFSPWQLIISTSRQNITMSSGIVIRIPTHLATYDHFS